MAKINLLLQLQRQKLLQENKERAGQNRSAKEDRSRTTKTADKASAPPATTPAAQAKQEEDARKKRELSGGSLDLYKRRRPAATDDDEEFRFFGITKRAPFVLPNSTVSFSGVWTATAESDLEFAPGVYTQTDTGFYIPLIRLYSALQRTNSYEYNTSVVAPKFFEELGASEKEYINMPEVQFPFSLQSIDWTLDQASAPEGRIGNSSIVGPPVFGTPPVIEPAFFLQLTRVQPGEDNTVYSRLIPSILRSDGRYIYYSTAVQTLKADTNFSNFEAGTLDYENFHNPITGFRRLSNHNRGPVTFNVGTTTVTGVSFSLPALRTKDVYEYENWLQYPLVHYNAARERPNTSIWSFNRQGRWLTNGSYQPATGYAVCKGLYWRYDTEAVNQEDAISFSEIDLSFLGATYATRKSTLSNYFDNQDINNPIRIIWEYKKSLNTTGLPLPDIASSFISTNENTLTVTSYPENFVYNQSTGIATEVLGSDVYTIELAENLAYEIAASTAKNTPKSEWEASTTYDTAQSTDPDSYIRLAHRAT